MGAIGTLFSRFPGQGVNGDKGPAVGPIETMVPRLPGQKVNGDKGPAVGPIETMVLIRAQLWLQGHLGRRLTQKRCFQDSWTGGFRWLRRSCVPYRNNMIS